jgi:prephenate dehydratase
MNAPPLRVAFLGGRGAYSEVAALSFFGEAARIIPYQDFDDIFAAVSNGETDRGVLPIENSLAGSIHRNYDLLLRHDLSIVGEVQVPIAHQLITLPGVELADINRVYSHQQALAQCERWLTKNLPHAERITTYDTSGSVRLVKEQAMRDAAGLASQRAAEIYGMSILRSEVQDNPENFTRFVAVGREPIVPTGAAKTSIVFAMDNVPGALFKSLAVFALRDIDLTKIESRPWQGKRWQYLFYIDFAGSIAEERCQKALAHLQEITSYFRVLGSYPRGV